MMKKVYHAPELEIEVYQMDASIASNCALVVEMGPDGPGVPSIQYVCDDYYEKTGEARITSRARSMPHNVQFWTDESCDCYYSAGDAGCFTS